MSEKLYIIATDNGIGALYPNLDSMIAALSYYASKGERFAYLKEGEWINVYEITYNPLYLPPIKSGDVHITIDDCGDVVAFRYSVIFGLCTEHIVTKDNQELPDEYKDWIVFKGQHSCRVIC